jgi:hypothetical protein
MTPRHLPDEPAKTSLFRFYIELFRGEKGLVNGESEKTLYPERDTGGLAVRPFSGPKRTL